MSGVILCVAEGITRCKNTVNGSYVLCILEKMPILLHPRMIRVRFARTPEYDPRLLRPAVRMQKVGVIAERRCPFRIRLESLVIEFFSFGQFFLASLEQIA